MTSANSQLTGFASAVRQRTGLKGGAVGTVPDVAHMSPPAGYHVGVDDIRRAGRYDRDYSTRQSRDRLAGTNLCSAWDIGDDWPNGGRAAWLRFNNLLLQQMQAADPALAPLRAINFSPDGRARKRYDTNNRAAGVVSSTDNVEIHTHGEFWRDTIGTPALTACLNRILAVIDAAIANRPLSPATPAAPTRKDNAMFYAADAKGQLYVCDGKDSRPVAAGSVPHINTLIREGLIIAQNRPDAPRAGFFPDAFGAPPTMIDVNALATALAPVLANQLDGVEEGDIVTALTSPEGQAALTTAAAAGAEYAQDH